MSQIGQIAWQSIRAVIIDLDGTLLDTVADLAAAANAVRLDAGMPALEQQRIGQFVGQGADILMHRTMTDSADGRLEPEPFARARAAFDHHYAIENGRHAQLFPGVRSGLDRMIAHGLKLACVTNKPQMFTDPLLARHELTACFEIVLGGDALPRKKPDPLPLLHIAQTFDLTPGQCLMIGDSINDARAARSAGMPVLIVPYGYNEGHDVATLDCDGIVNSLDHAARLLGA